MTYLHDALLVLLGGLLGVFLGRLPSWVHYALAVVVILLLLVVVARG